MKIIDEKGKLFGVLNIIDLLILVFVVLAAGAVYLFFSENMQENGVNSSYNITVELKNMEEGFYEAIEVDKKVFDRVQNKPLGMLTDARAEPAYDYTVSAENGSVKKVDVPNRYNIELDITTDSDSELFVGKRVSVGTKDFAGAGYIIKLEKFEK